VKLHPGVHWNQAKPDSSSSGFEIWVPSARVI
jgi:hypothetical protein